MTLKERYLKIKAAFDGTPPIAPATPPAAAAPPPPAATPAAGALAAKTYKLKDGVTEISINQAGELPAVGDMVTINGAPAPAGTHVLEDDSTITVDATGAITAYTAAPVATPPSPPPPSPPPPPAQPITLAALTDEQMSAMYAKFAGSIEEQVGSLIIMVKALMEDRFGWKIREGQENAAIAVYKDTVAAATPAPSVTIEEMGSVFTKTERFNEQSAALTKLETSFKELLELTGALVELPTADPKTLTGPKKEQFSDKKQGRIEKMAAAVKAMKEEANK